MSHPEAKLRYIFHPNPARLPNNCLISTLRTTVKLRALIAGHNVQPARMNGRNSCWVVTTACAKVAPLKPAMTNENIIVFNAAPIVWSRTNLMRVLGTESLVSRISWVFSSRSSSFSLFVAAAATADLEGVV